MTKLKIPICGIASLCGIGWGSRACKDEAACTQYAMRGLCGSFMAVRHVSACVGFMRANSYCADMMSASWVRVLARSLR